MKEFNCKDLEGVELPDDIGCVPLPVLENINYTEKKEAKQNFSKSPLEACVKVMYEFEQMRRILLKSK